MGNLCLTPDPAVKNLQEAILTPGPAAMPAKRNQAQPSPHHSITPPQEKNSLNLSCTMLKSRGWPPLSKVRMRL